MQKHVLVVHGAGVQRLRRGSVYWKAKLEDALGAGYEVSCPKMPDPARPRYAAWRRRIEKSLAGLEAPLVLVGHSLGGSVLLKYLSEEKLGSPISGLCILSVPYWDKDEGWDSDDFALRGDLSGLGRIPRIFLYHSRNDPEVPFEHLALYAEKLPQATLRPLDGREHEFHKAELPELVDDIRACLGKALGETLPEPQPV